MLLALLACLSVAGCGFAAFLQPTDEVVGCTLEPVTGTLEFENGHAVLRHPAVFGPLQDPLPVKWPAGWQLRESPDGGQVIDRRGKLQATAGEVIAVYAQSNNGSPLIENGVLLACPYDVIPGGWPQSS
jgi:hypothetical protein